MKDLLIKEEGFTHRKPPCAKHKGAERVQFRSKAIACPTYRVEEAADKSVPNHFFESFEIVPFSES